MIYQLVNKRTEILPLSTSHIARLCNQFNHALALLISMPHLTLKSIELYQNRPKIKLFLQKKIQNLRALGALPPDPGTTPHCRFLASRLITPHSTNDYSVVSSAITRKSD